MDAPWRVRTEQIQGPPGPGKYLNATAQQTPTWTSDVATFTMTVTGAVVGSPAVVTADAALGPLVPLAQVTAAGVVTVTLLWFGNGGPPALTGANWTAYVLVQGA